MNRSRFEQVVDLLDVIGRFPEKSTSAKMQTANLNCWSGRNLLLQKLKTHGFVDYELNSDHIKNVHLTSKSQEFLRVVKPLMREMEDVTKE
jgi:predicted transcriptional regulator